LVGKKVLVFDKVNEILFHVTREKVGFKFNDFDSKGKLIQKKDKKVENKKTKKCSNPFTDEFVEGLTRGMIDQDSIIKKSFLGKTIKFKNSGVITNCFVTSEKIGSRFGDFTYTYENEVMKKMPILSNTSNEKRPKYKDLTPKKKKRQTVEPIKEKKPRKKKKPGKKKEPWEYEGKSFLDKYNGGK
jgi:ribosomal protein S19